MADEIDISEESIETPIEEVVEKRTLKEEIRENLNAIKEREKEEPKDVKSIEKPKKLAATGMERIGKDRPAPGNVPTAIVKEPKPELPPIVAPISWKAETKAKWDKLPREIQEEVNRRETEVEKKFTQFDEERNFGKSLKEVVNPYMPLINSSNTTPQKAIGEMLNYAHILQTGTPTSKAQLLWQLAQRWGADMRITPQAAAQPAHQLQTLSQELAAVKQELARQPELLKQQQEEVKLKSVIEAFAADPKNIYYEKVKPVMASLLSTGGATDMQDAYSKACYADPDIRSSLLIEQKKAEEVKRIAEKKAKADAARNAASSIKGSAGLNGQTSSTPKRSLREELQANFRAATEH